MTIGFLGILLALGGAIGIAGINISNRDLKALYTTQLASSVALGEVSGTLARSRLFLFIMAADPNSPNAAKLVHTSQGLLGKARNAWATYRTLSNADPDDAAKAAAMDEKLTRVFTASYEPIYQALSTGDAERVRSTVQATQTLLYTEVAEGIVSLQKRQAEVAASTYARAQARFSWFVAVCACGVGVALVAAALAWLSLQRAISRGSPRRLTNISSRCHVELGLRRAAFARRAKDARGEAVAAIRRFCLLHPQILCYRSTNVTKPF